MNVERDLNAAWQFMRDEGPLTEVDLPHDAMITEPRDWGGENGTRTGYFPGGRYRYARTFALSTHDVAGYVGVRFEGIYHRSVVIVNGEEVARHANGYTEFEVDIGRAARVGENTIEVLVDNSQEPNSRWYSGSGIYRPVTLVVRTTDRIEGVTIVTVDTDPPTVHIDAGVTGEASVDVFDQDGKLLVSGGMGRLEIPGAKLWSAETPNLYRAVISTQTDEVQTTFGIRTLDWSAERGFRVNGVETKFRGACIHHDNGILGARCYADAEARKVRILKAAGYNAIRSAHNPCSRAMLDACDRYGMYVIDEAFDGWYTPKSYHDYARDFDDNFQSDLSAMVEKDVNHPSVIMYSLGNEVTEPVQQRGKDLTKAMAEYVRSLDSTRPVTCGLNFMLIRYDMGFKDATPYDPNGSGASNGVHDQSNRMAAASGSTLYNALVSRLGTMMALAVKGKRVGRAVEEVASHLDVVGYNYAERRYDEDVKATPDRLIVGSETMVAHLPYNWRRVQRHPQVIGDFVWTGWDYLGEIGLGYWAYPSEADLQVSNGGATIDLIGNADAQNFFQQIVWGLRTTPWIGVSPLTHAHETPKKGPWRMTNAVSSWSWHGYEGTQARVEVYADAARVTLLVNGRVVGTKRVHDYIARFRTPYTPGTLEAVALDRRGQEVSRAQLQSAHPDVELFVQPDVARMRANGQDLCFVDIRLTDHDGVIHAGHDREVTVTVTGEAASLAAVGSANPRPPVLFNEGWTTTWFGSAQAVIRATRTPGCAVVTVVVPGQEPQTLELEVVLDQCHRKEPLPPST